MGGGGDRYGPSSYSKKYYSKSEKSSKGPVSKASSSSYEYTETKQHTSVEPPSVDESTKQAILSSFVHGADKTGIDVAFSFDTTGSMYPCLAEVRSKLHVIITRLLEDIPNIRIAIVAHGDYCDQDNSYVIKSQDFSTDVKKLCAFVKDVEKTGGGDAPEAYELVLRDALSLSWDDNHSKALIMIGDEIPHPASYTDQNIFWKNSLKHLCDRGVVIYGVQALHNGHATPFYSEISSQSGGFHLHLRDFALITEMFVAVCFRATSEEKFQEYKKQVESDGKMTSQVQQMLTEMAKPAEKKTFDLREAWWDLQYDHGKPLYGWDAKLKKWVAKR